MNRATPLLLSGAGCSLKVLFLAASLLGVAHSIRVEVAQSIYFNIKYGAARNDLSAIFKRSEIAHRIYPFNYYLCMWVAETAYENGCAGGTESQEQINIARRWCDRGLKLNFYRSELREIKTRLLARESPDAAVSYWKEYVNWHFWEPYNHGVMAELLAGAGRFDLAEKALYWVKGSDHYQYFRERVTSLGGKKQ